MSVHRLFVKKRYPFHSESRQLLRTIQEDLHIPITNLTIYERYDIYGISEEEYIASQNLIFSDPPTEECYTTLPLQKDDTPIAIEYVPGQYDQRADSGEQCLAMLTSHTHGTVRTARVFVLSGQVSREEKNRITQFFLSSIDYQQASLTLPTMPVLTSPSPKDIEYIDTFLTMTKDELYHWLQQLQLAMTIDDMLFVQAYFQKEQRPPSITEIRVLDTYWSDHCRHSTFLTKLTNITFEPSDFTLPIQNTYKRYIATREQLGLSQTNPTLMDMATIGVKELRAKGLLKNLDSSDEINACTIIVPVDVDGSEEEWLLSFKNETHNHPTEIEPFGGAATCLGGCIRDPLSGRTYVYQAMRITGSADPLTPRCSTLPGKLPQSYITTTAARGFSSYGNQIGVPTGEVREYYHPGYGAKRMEVGAVIGAAPRHSVRRESPAPGDIIVLVGGKTGRDGCGGATGSSKSHTDQSLTHCGAEVQKGKPLTERKLQRLFRNPQVCACIKRCNDFGAGGVAVAIGELAPSVYINLDTIPTKYHGLDGTELAISESQERMACVLSPTDWLTFQNLCNQENIDVTIVGHVTNSGKLVMVWNGTKIVNIHRDFLNTNGATQHAAALIVAPANIEGSVISKEFSFHHYQNRTHPLSLADRFHLTLQSLLSTSQQGLQEQFDSTVGGNTVLFPFSGAYRKTPVQGMVAKLPVLQGTTSTTSIMTHGFDPYLSEWSPYHGAQYAVLLSIAKLAALGGDIRKAYVSFQEYFEKLKSPNAWGKVVSALLGAYEAQHQLQIAAIGGKDSMSGSFMDLSVPPTLISFAVTTEHIEHIVSPHFHQANHAIVLMHIPEQKDGTPNWDVFKSHCHELYQLNLNHSIYSAYVVEQDGIGPATVKACLGNRLGCLYDAEVIEALGQSLLTPMSEEDTLFYPLRGSLLIEVTPTVADTLTSNSHIYNIARTIQTPHIIYRDTIMNLQNLENSYESTLQPIFPIYAEDRNNQKITDTIDLRKHSFSSSSYETTSSKFVSPNNIWNQRSHYRSHSKLTAPRVVIPVFPGTNCEYETARAFAACGANVQEIVICNRSPQDLKDSIERIKQAIDQSQILCFPGGFSAGDEPAGSGKFIATYFRNPYLQEALETLLYKRDGLVLGICNGFQALLKLGLLPGGHIQPLTETSPTLTYNTISRHISCMVHTKVVSTSSPWLTQCQIGDIYTVPISHGEGRFIANKEQLTHLYAQYQIATQYVDPNGQPTYDPRWNPNQSIESIEGLLSPDGRIFGKMAHIERVGAGIHKNIEGTLYMPIFASGVSYFTD